MTRPVARGRTAAARPRRPPKRGARGVLRPAARRLAFLDPGARQLARRGAGDRTGRFVAIARTRATAGVPARPDPSPAIAPGLSMPSAHSQPARARTRRREPDVESRPLAPRRRADRVTRSRRDSVLHLGQPDFLAGRLAGLDRGRYAGPMAGATSEVGRVLLVGEAVRQHRGLGAGSHTPPPSGSPFRIRPSCGPRLVRRRAAASLRRRVICRTVWRKRCGQSAAVASGV
jgi:hypothetical protein